MQSILFHPFCLKGSALKQCRWKIWKHSWLKRSSGRTVIKQIFFHIGSLLIGSFLVKGVLIEHFHLEACHLNSFDVYACVDFQACSRKLFR